MKQILVITMMLMRFLWVDYASAQTHFTRVEIVTDTSETTRKLLSGMDNQTFQKWVKSISERAEMQRYRFDAPPLAQFNDSFNFKVNVSDFNDTTDIYIQLQRKSVSDASKVLAKISLNLPPASDETLKKPVSPTKPIPPTKPITNNTGEVSQLPKEGINFKLADQGNDDTTVRPMPKGGIKFNVAQPVCHGTASSFNFNLGLLQMQNFTGPSTTVMRYNEMPELNNAKTLNIGFDAMWGLNLYRGNVRFWYGISYDFYNYRFQNNAIRIDPNQDQFEYRFADANDPNELNPEKSKLVSEYIGIPLAISFENSKWNASKVRLMIGVQGGYLMNAYTKVKYYDDRVTKNYDDFHLNEIVVQPFFRFQWDHWALYGKYSITPLTRSREGNLIDPIISGQKNMVLGMSFVID